MRCLELFKRKPLPNMGRGTGPGWLHILADSIDIDEEFGFVRRIALARPNMHRLCFLPRSHDQQGNSSN